MASRTKRKSTTLHEQDALLKAFYNEIDESEEYFLLNRFIDEDDIDHDYESGSDDKKAESEADVTKVEQEIERIEEEDVDMENIMKERKSNDFEKSATIQWKQRFKFLDDILNDNNYDNATPQAERSFEYTGSKKKVKMEWKINKDKKIHKRGAENVYKNKPGPRRAAKSVKTHPQCSNFFSQINWWTTLWNIQTRTCYL